MGQCGWGFRLEMDGVGLLSLILSVCIAYIVLGIKKCCWQLKITTLAAYGLLRRET